MSRIVLAVELAVSVALCLAVHGSAQALVADRLGDPTGRRWGRISLDPRRGIDRFGTLLLPGLGILLVAAGYGSAPVFAYATSVPLDEARLGRGRTALALGAGPISVLALGAAAGTLLRGGDLAGELTRAAAVLVWVASTMAVMHCLPIPGLDASRLLRWALPPRAASVYAELDAYLPLFLIVLFFVVGGTFLGIVSRLTSPVCELLSGRAIC